MYRTADAVPPPRLPRRARRQCLNRAAETQATDGAATVFRPCPPRSLSSSPPPSTPLPLLCLLFCVASPSPFLTGGKSEEGLQNLRDRHQRVEVRPGQAARCHELHQPERQRDSHPAGELACTHGVDRGSSTLSPWEDIRMNHPFRAHVWKRWNVVAESSVACSSASA